MIREITENEIIAASSSSADAVEMTPDGTVQLYRGFNEKSTRRLNKSTKDDERRRIHEVLQNKNEQKSVMTTIQRIWKSTLGRWGDDWFFLALLGTIMALLSFAMDETVALSFKGRLWLYEIASIHIVLQFIAWVSVPVIVMVAAALLVGKTAPQAAGSGLPELKAIVRGGQLKGFFGPYTLLSKIVGITSTLSCGLPLGREGSLIHISTIIGTMLSKVINLLNNSSKSATAADIAYRNYDVLAAGVSVGVATTFASPIGGVLFSIEVFSVYFAVRNYWRGFFAAVCGAVIFRLLSVWFSREDTVVAIYLTNFSRDFPFDPQELLVYSLLGVLSGAGAAAYIWMHRKCVTFVRTNPFVQRHIYLFVAFTVASTLSLTFPAGIGKYMAGDIYTVDQVKALFKNFTWTKDNFTSYEKDIISHWGIEEVGVFTSLGIYIVFTWFFSIWCSSMPVPLGNFGPVFKMGAAVGRLTGELLFLYAPNGFRYGKITDPVIPGSYATVGAAAFSGAVTHTISTSVIVIEMTGQVTHIFPLMISVLIATGVCNLLQPSIYESIIMIKQLPFLPHLQQSPYPFIIFVKDFMVKNIKYIWHGITYHELLDILNENENISSFPLVNSKETMVLLGSIQRNELQKLIDQHLGDERRLYVAAHRLSVLSGRLSRNNSKTSFSSDLEEIVRRGSVDDLIVNYSVPQRKTSYDLGRYNPAFEASSSISNSLVQKQANAVRKSCSFSSDIPMHYIPTVRSYHTFHAPSENDIRPSILRRSSSTIIHNVAYMLDETGGDGLKSIQDSIDDITNPHVVDMTPEERIRWETSELRKAAALGMCTVDPSPFQLVVSTPLAKVHSLFCILKVRRAYVTHVGRLVGVVSLPELRRATEAANARTLPEQMQPLINKGGTAA